MASQPATILVVDDTPESLRFVTATLEKAGMTVLIAGDGAAALQSLELAGERSLPDLVIMDAMMPVMDGFETTRRIKADPRFARLPVIFMTGLTETEHVVRGLEAGGVDYVTKPIVVEELLARIRVHLGNARVSSGSQAALDESGRPLLAVDGAGRLLWATPRSIAMLARLFPPEGLPAPALAAALARHVGSDGQGVVRHDLEDGRLELTLLTRNGSDEWLFRLAEIREGAEERLLAAKHGLTEREAEVLLWISRGKANREISEILGISPRTVNKHLEQVFEKMGIENRASAAAAAVKTLTQ
ncbi:response regulator [Sandarakinorhabdus sp. DWP1-3-1]|uniref:response regulator n=1 Tax=Sandarakinorhabdus sp. DWP1-3-1 TaxID=2804627 RepID=UPI003CF4E9BB